MVVLARVSPLVRGYELAVRDVLQVDGGVEGGQSDKVFVKAHIETIDALVLSELQHLHHPDIKHSQIAIHATSDYLGKRHCHLGY